VVGVTDVIPLMALGLLYCLYSLILFAVMWDGMNKKKLTSLAIFPTSISALAFNHDGYVSQCTPPNTLAYAEANTYSLLYSHRSEIAIASSYTFEDGEREHPRDEIYVREMLDSECKPKS
jgi:cell cycle arrest protein BUB3